MTINKKLDGSVLTMELVGRLNTSTAPELDAEIKNSVEGVSELIMDLKELEYISSAGLRVILSGSKLMTKQQGQFSVTNVRDTVKEVFEVTGFDSILNII